MEAVFDRLRPEFEGRVAFVSSTWKQMPLISRWTPWLEKAAGFVLVGFGLYYVWSA
ncbi:MAG TPA: hypothetical protein GX513_12305 [Firmicutes bacterium]|nr:hypothetical protein [Bacillota bacterium]